MGDIWYQPSALSRSSGPLCSQGEETGNLWEVLQTLIWRWDEWLSGNVSLSLLINEGIEMMSLDQLSRF